MKLSRVSLAVIGAIVIGAIAAGIYENSLAQSPPDYEKRNEWDGLRWPWTCEDVWRITQGWGGATSHTGSIYYAVDFSKGAGGGQPVFAAADGDASCEDLTAYNLGYAIRVVFDSGSDIYAHPDECSIQDEVSVAQGRHITYTGTTGSYQGQYADHLHFQTCGSDTCTGSSAFTMEGISDFDDDDVYDKWAESDNLSAGYTEPPISWESAIHDKYEDEDGWDVVGSTAEIPSFTPGRSPASICSSGVTSGWYQCDFNDINGDSRAGRIQTFKGVGSGDGQHAIFKRSSGSATFMSRGLLGPLTDEWATGKDGFFYLGYPTGDSFSTGGGQVQMNFQNGWGVYTISSCASEFYWWSDFLGQYVNQDPSNYCD